MESSSSSSSNKSLVFSAFIINFWLAGLTNSLGVLLIEVTQAYPNSTPSQLALIPTVLVSMSLLITPFASFFSQKFSDFSVIFVGGLSCSTGMILSYFATHVHHLYITIGFLIGAGYGLSSNCAIMTVAKMFKAKRALATGICVSGTALGGMVLPYFIKMLGDYGGFKVLVIVLGILMLTVCMCSYSFKTFEVNPLPQIETADKKSKKLIDLRIFRNREFIFINLSVFLMAAGVPNVLYFLPLHLISLGYTKSDVNFILLIGASCDLFCRPVFGWLLDYINRKIVYLLSIFLCGISIIILPSILTYNLIATLSVLYIICQGIWFLLFPVILADFIPFDTYSSAYGLIKLCQCMSVATFLPFTGIINDIFGNYYYSFYIMGGSMVIGCLPVLLLICLRSKPKKIPSTIAIEEV